MSVVGEFFQKYASEGTDGARKTTDATSCSQEAEAESDFDLLLGTSTGKRSCS